MFSSGRSSSTKSSSKRLQAAEKGRRQPLILDKIEEDDKDDGLRWVGGFCGGVLSECRRRFTRERLYADWVDDALTWKTASAVLLMFFTTFISTLALGELISKSTNGLIGINEYLMMSSASGMLHSVFSCQPLLVLRPTGQITFLLEQLVHVATAYALPFWPFFAWTGMFVGFLMILVAAFELSHFFHYVTPFVDGIFATFIGFIYISDGMQGILALWYNRGTNAGSAQAASDVFSVYLTVLITCVALWLSSMQSSKLFSFEFRSLVVDYALIISFFLAIVLACWLSEYFTPMVFIDTSKVGLTTTTYRPWVPELLSLSPFGIFMAALSSIPIVIFFYLDQNISSALCQAPEMKLTRGSYYHSSFGFLGVLSICGPLVGLPFVMGSFPHSPQLVLSLTDYDDKKRPAIVRENRLAPFLFSMLLCFPLLFPFALSLIPKAAVSATLIFLGIQNVIGTTLFERVLIMCMEPENWPLKQAYSRVEPQVMALYTSIQIGLVAGLCICSSLLGLAFPFFLASLVPFRWLVMTGWFSEDDLNTLDELDVTNEEEQPWLTGHDSHRQNSRSSIGFCAKSELNTTFFLWASEFSPVAVQQVFDRRDRSNSGVATVDCTGDSDDMQGGSFVSRMISGIPVLNCSGP